MAGSFAAIALIMAAGTTAVGATPKALDPTPSPVRDPMHRSGIITNDDYPSSALRERAEGASAIDLEIGADGRVTGCAISRSSGNAALDSTACSLAQRRFRFTPALDAKGLPAAGRASRTVDWRLPDENPDSSGTTPASD